MRTLKIICLLLSINATYVQAQSSTTTKDQKRTIEINNDNGDLYISFTNGEITEFVVNDNAVPTDQYSDYQTIIDEFAEEEVLPPSPPAPTPPVAPEAPADESAKLFEAITDYLVSKDLISNTKKFKVELKSKFLKVNGKELSKEDHSACLDLFTDIYGHELNSRSEVKFKKSKRNSKSSVKIHK